MTHSFGIRSIILHVYIGRPINFKESINDYTVRRRVDVCSSTVMRLINSLHKELNWVESKPVTSNDPVIYYIYTFVEITYVALHAH